MFCTFASAASASCAKFTQERYSAWLLALISFSKRKPEAVYPDVCLVKRDQHASDLIVVDTADPDTWPSDLERRLPIPELSGCSLRSFG